MWKHHNGCEYIDVENPNNPIHTFGLQGCFSMIQTSQSVKKMPTTWNDLLSEKSKNETGRLQIHRVSHGIHLWITRIPLKHWHFMGSQFSETPKWSHFMIMMMMMIILCTSKGYALHVDFLDAFRALLALLADGTGWSKECEDVFWWLQSAWTRIWSLKNWYIGCFPSVAIS